MKRSKPWFSFTSPSPGTIRIHFTDQCSQPSTSCYCSPKGKAKESAAASGFRVNRRVSPSPSKERVKKLWSSSKSQNETHNLQKTHPFLEC